MNVIVFQLYMGIIIAFAIVKNAEVAENESRIWTKQKTRGTGGLTMAKEYIEREAALNASKIVYIECIEVDGEGYEEGNADNIPVVFKKDIEALPAADVVEVVRCKDCLNWKKDAYGGVCDRYGVRIGKDWFCAGGERRDGNG